MVHKLDESVGRIISALEEANMLHNSVILFAADNGAPTIGEFPNWGSNYPLRGIKETLWEGGVRSASFIWSPMIKKTPRLSTELMHITDWLPTLYAAAGTFAHVRKHVLPLIANEQSTNKFFLWQVEMLIHYQIWMV